MTDYQRDKASELTHTDPSQRYLYPHAARFGEYYGNKIRQVRGLPNVATYTVGRDPSVRRYVATFEGHVTQIGEPKIADRRVTIFAPNREDAERCAEHIARDEVWALLGLREDC